VLKVTRVWQPRDHYRTLEKRDFLFFPVGTCPLNVCFPTLDLYAGRADMHRHQSDWQQETQAYYRLLRHLLTGEVQHSFKEEQEPLTGQMSDLMRQLEESSRKSPNTKTNRSDGAQPHDNSKSR